MELFKSNFDNFSGFDNNAPYVQGAATANIIYDSLFQSSAFQVTLAVKEDFAGVKKSLTPSRQLNAHTRFYFDRLPSLGQTYRILEFSSSWAGMAGVVDILSDGKIRIIFRNNGVYVADSNMISLEANRIHRLEFEEVCSLQGIGGSYCLIVNGIELTDISQVNVDTQMDDLDIVKLGAGFPGGTSPTPSIIVFDDLTIADTRITLPPLKGVLECYAYLDMQEVGATVEVVNVDSFVTPFSLELDSGNYTLRATYKDETLERTTTIIKGQRTREDFHYTTPPPPPPITHTLSVDSTPIQGVPFTLKRVS